MSERLFWELRSQNEDDSHHRGSSLDGGIISGRNCLYPSDRRRGVVDYDYKKNEGNGWYSEPSSNYRFKLGFKQGERASANPVLVATLKSTDTEHLRGKAAIELQITAREEQKSLKAAYKVDISSVLPSDPFSPPVAVPKDWYHGFALKIDAASYQLPRGQDRN